MSRNLILGAFCLALVGLVMWTAQPVAAAEAYSVKVEKDVQYGTGAGEPLTLHLAKPIGVEGPVPAIMVIHGGGWAAGSKDSHLGHIKLMAEQGYVAATVGYRFAPTHRFPAQVEDVKCAVRYIRAHADELGVDPQRIGAVGFSAGAHLSMMLGTMDSSDGMEGDGGWPDQSSKVQAVVSYFGPVKMDPETLSSSPAREMVAEAAVRKLLGDLIGGPVDDNVDKLLAASPITYVNEGDAPMLLLQGTKDPLVPYDQAMLMATAMTEAKIPGRVEFLMGMGHGWMGNEIVRTQAATMAFFDEHLRSDD